MTSELVYHVFGKVNACYFGSEQIGHVLLLLYYAKYLQCRWCKEHVRKGPQKYNSTHFCPLQTAQAIFITLFLFRYILCDTWKSLWHFKLGANGRSVEVKRKMHEQKSSKSSFDMMCFSPLCHHSQRWYIIEKFFPRHRYILCPFVFFTQSR